MPSEQLRILFFGAHPDDCEWFAGGTSLLYTRLGHKVKYVSMTNGNAGHNQMSGAPLARRRREEAAAAAKILGVESLMLDHDDGYLMSTIENRNEIIRIIREVQPDLVLTHRPNDYHPDHRYTGILVQDAIHSVIIGNNLPLVPAMPRMPVMMYMWDRFNKPYPFIPDVIVDIDEVYETKMDAIHCHTSQMYEFIFGIPDVPPAEWKNWLKEKAEDWMGATTRLYPQRLVETYGKERGEKVRHSEAFELCEYGSPMDDAERRRLFPFLP